MPEGGAAEAASTPVVAALEAAQERWARVFAATVPLFDSYTARRGIAEDRARAAPALRYDLAKRAALPVRKFRAPRFHAAGGLDEGDPAAGALAGLEPFAPVRTLRPQRPGLLAARR